MNSAIPDHAKWSYLTRHVRAARELRVGAVSIQPRAGDLVAVEVTAIGNHIHLEDAHGRQCRLFPGDLVIGAHGNRYASDYYEGYVSASPELHLLAASGLIGRVASTHTAYGEPTGLRVLGSVVDGDGAAVSLERFARPATPAPAPHMGTLVVVGSTMNAGKTTTTASILRGWRSGGLQAGGGKVTGTGSGKDRWAYVDAGATQVSDFLDFGIASSYGHPIDALERTMRSVRDALVSDGADAVVLEIADGLFQQETRALLPALHGFADGVVLAVADPLAAKAGADILRREGQPLRAISGVITASPLAAREASDITGLPVLSPTALAEGAAVELLTAQVA
jgi:hypothetical protein